MVLQRDRPIAVWGWSAPGEKITVQFHDQTKTIKADKTGQWLLHLDPEAAGGPFQFVVKGKNQLTFSQVLVGEVWICSGQSNMEMPIAGWGKINNFQQEIAAADFPDIRHFKVPNVVAVSPQKDLGGGDWKICSPATAGDFSSVAYFFARSLYRQLHVPVGLINTSWGGTHVETWTSRGAFEGSEEFRSMIGTLPDGKDLEGSAAAAASALKKAIGTFQGSLPPAGEEVKFKEISYDDSRWGHIKLPGTWEQAGLGLEALDGIVWFRRTIELTPEEAGKTMTLDLSKIDDIDETYVNGVKVGSTKDYNALRHYTIPAGTLKPGKNLIAIRVQDTGGGGGIYGEPGDLKYNLDGRVVSLTGDWLMSVVSFSINTALGPNSAPTLLYNAMISPLIPFTIRGAIWYQGEANAGRAYQYRKAFPLMITDWRQHWGEGDFPFYFVQLASWNAAGGNSEHGSSWAELREAQAMTLSLPNTGMAVTTDIGDAKDIHPKNKQDVGSRLAAIALHNLYGQTTAEYSGPIFQSMTTAGASIVLHFTHTGSGLTAHDKYGYLKGFEIAGADHQFHYARALIDGDKVVVSQDGITAPVAVRYSWADDAGESNLFNKDGFPAAPFRTDQWKGVTEANKYQVGK